MTGRLKNKCYTLILSTLCTGALLCILLTPTAYASTELVDEVKELLFDELPDLGQVLPEYVVPTGNGPSLAIGDFYTHTDDRIDWGRVLGEVMRTSLAGHLNMPSHRVVRGDAWGPGIAPGDQMRSDESVGLYYERYGIRTILVGALTVKQNDFQWTIYLKHLPERETVLELVYSGALEDIPVTVQQVTMQVLKTIGVTDSAEWLKISEISVESLREYGRLLTNIKNEPGMNVFAASSDFVKKRSILVPPALLYIENYPLPRKRHEIAEQQDEFHRLGYQYPGSAAVQLCLARNMMPTSGVHNVLATKIRALKRYVSLYPEDPMGFVLLADVLASNDRQLEGIVVTLESIRRWPENFRAWWDMAWALDSYAWRLRGDGYWRDVPEGGKRMFPMLKNLSLQASNQALSRNQDDAKLWHQKMRSLGAYNREFKNAFDMAIGLDPYYQAAYETALNYASPKWGGSTNSQLAIVELAKRNNPGATWPNELRRIYVSEEEVKQLTLYDSVIELIRLLFY
jgi:hypothetical protein